MAANCAPNQAVNRSKEMLSKPQSLTSTSWQRPQPSEIVEFQARSIPTVTYFKDFEITQSEIEAVIATWHEVSKEHWLHGYSHVALENRTGTIKLKSGTVIEWMVKPGGLATLTFPDGKMMYLAKELTTWKGSAEQGAAADADKPRR